MKIFSVITLLLGIVCAFVQINDPDPYLWIAAYFLLVLLSIMHFVNKKNTLIAKIVIMVYAAAFAFYIPAIMQWFQDGMPSVVQSMKAETKYVELVREGGGLLMALVLASVFFFDWKSKKG
jgi:Transmembrane family 220, helix